jgi:hypothetical protein
MNARGLRSGGGNKPKIAWSEEYGMSSVLAFGVTTSFRRDDFYLYRRDRVGSFSKARTRNRTMPN